MNSWLAIVIFTPACLCLCIRYIIFLLHSYWSFILVPVVWTMFLSEGWTNILKLQGLIKLTFVETLFIISYQISPFTVHKGYYACFFLFVCLFSPFMSRHRGFDDPMPAAPHVHKVYFSNTRGSCRACCGSCSDKRLNGLLDHCDVAPLFPRFSIFDSR